MRYLALILLTATILFASTARTESVCPWGDGGYCVDTLARETLKVIQGKADLKTEPLSKLSLPESQTAPDALSGGIPYFNFYDWSCPDLVDGFKALG